jgi:hypothetical protein
MIPSTRQEIVAAMPLGGAAKGILGDGWTLI